MNKLQKKRYFKIKETAQLLGVSTKTLRRWDLSGRLKPKRTVKNNYRYYTYSQIEKVLTSIGSSVEKNLVLNSKPRVIRKITRTSPEIQELIVGMDRVSRVPRLIKIFGGSKFGLLSFLLDRLSRFLNPSRLPFPHLGFSKRQKKIILASAITTFSSIYTAQSLKAASTPTSTDVSPSVLGISDEALEFNFKVNVPAIFENTTFNGATTFNNTASFKQSLVAPNILYSLSTADDSGIQVEGIQNLVVTNTDKGSDQLFFGTVSVSGQSDVVSDTNSDTFTFAAGTGISLSTSADDDKLTITNTSLNESGWIDGGTVIYNETLTDKVGIGTITPASLLEVVGTVQFKGSSSTIGMYVNSSGYVGIGTTSPSNSLTIDSGTGDVSGVTLAQMTSSSPAGVGGGKVLSLDSGGKIILVNDQTGGGSAEDILPSATSGSTLYFNGTNWASSTNLFHDGGSVGISTDAPAGRLEVETNEAATIGLIVQGYTSQTSNLQEWRNMAGGTLSYIDSSGVFNGTISAGGGSIDPGLTLGSILFQGGSGINQDNTNFFWDDTDNFLKLPEIHLTSIASSTSTTAGSMYYDSDDNQLKLYTGSKWQADRSSATLIVAANDSQNKEKADFVADGTDDDVTIETAIAALPTGGGKVVLLEGTYSIGDAAGDGVDITKSNVTIEGQGDATILQRKANAVSSDGVITISGGAYQNITITNITIDGQFATHTSNNNFGIYIVNGGTHNISNITISDNYIYDSPYGITISVYNFQNARLAILNNRISDYNYNAISSYGNYSVVSNNIIYDSNTIGTGLYISGRYSQVTGNTIEGGSYGISVGSTFNYGVIASNTIEGTNSMAITIPASDNTISGNTLTNSNQHGIYSSNGSRNIFDSNIISQVGSSDFGIFLQHGDDNIISNNRIYDTSGSLYGIYLEGSAQNNYFIGNDITGAGWTSAEIYDNSSGTGNTFQERDQFHLDPIADAYTTLEGDIFYDSDDDKLKVYNGTAWNNLNEDGKSSTIIVAASNSLDTSKADYIASGTDDDITIETAIAALPAGGGKITLLEGTFSIGDAAGDGVDITKSNVTIEGQGDSTILQRQGSNVTAYDGIITLGDGGTTAVTNVMITNLAIDSNKASYASAYHSSLYFNQYVSYSTINNLSLQNATNASIRFVGASAKENQYNTISNNRISNDGSYGIYIDDTYIRHNTFTGNHFVDGVYGIYANGSNSDVFSHNTFYSTSNMGMYIFGAKNSSIIGNTVKDATLVNNSLGTTCDDCVIMGNTTMGGGRGISVSGNRNTISGNTINNPAYEGIYIFGNDHIISNNNVYAASGSEAIEVKSGSGSYVSGNIITGTWGTELLITATNVTIQQNNQFHLDAIADAHTTNDGDIFYDSDDNYLKLYTGSAWENLNVADTKSSTIVVAASNSLDTSKADYVASGTDDDVTIETAIAALPAGGGKVVLLEGTFSIGDTAGDGVDITKSNVTIEGQGDATILQRAGNAVAIDGVITVGDGGTTTVSDVTISNIQIDGAKATYSSANNQGIYANLKSSNITIQNNNFINIADANISLLGASGTESTGNFISNNRFSNSGTEYSIIFSYTNETTVANNHIDSSGGIETLNSDNNNIANNFIQTSGNDAPINFSSGSNYNNLENNQLVTTQSSISIINFNATSNYNKAIGNNITGGAGVDIRGTYHTFSQNYIEAPGGRGMIIYASHSIFDGNIIEDVNASQNGIYLAGNAANNIFSNNKINDDSAATAIYFESATVDSNFFIGNEITGTWTTKINDAGTNTTIQQRDHFQLNADGEIALDISGSAIGQALVQLDELGDQAIFTASSSGVLQFIIANDGNVGIGTAAPAYALDVLASGTGIIARFSSDNSSGCTLADGGTISCTSDERLKTNIVSLGESIIDQVMDLRAVEYDWKSGPGEYKHLGFIAQEVESIFPSLVSTDEATGYKQLNTISMVPLLTKALQEQQHQIETLKLEVTDQGEIISNSTYLKQVASDVDDLRIDQDNLVNSVLGISDELSSTASQAANTREDVESVKDQLTQITDLVNMLSADATQSASFSIAQSIGSDLSLDGLDASKTATFSSILVSGDTVLNNLGITGSLTTGTLLMDGLTNTIKSVGFEPLIIQPSILTGIEFMGGKISMDINGNLNFISGVIKGNDTFRGQATLDADITSIHVDQSWSEAPISIQTTPTFDTNTWIEDINQNGFTIHTSTASSDDQQIHWLAIW